jgi:serine/threonine protein kinase
MLNLQIGTPGYVAPEISKPNGELYNAQKADIYSLGVCLYMMLTGEFPENQSSLSFGHTQSSTNSVVKEEADEPNRASFHKSLEGKNLSEDVQNLLCGMLHINPDERFSIFDVCSHSWFVDFDIPSIASEVYFEMVARNTNENSNLMSENLVY